MRTWHKIAAAPVVAMAFLMILGGMAPGKRPEPTADFGTHFVDLMQRGGGQLVAAYWQEYEVTSPADEKLANTADPVLAAFRDLHVEEPD